MHLYTHMSFHFFLHHINIHQFLCHWSWWWTRWRRCRQLSWRDGARETEETQCLTEQATTKAEWQDRATEAGKSEVRHGERLCGSVGWAVSVLLCLCLLHRQLNHTSTDDIQPYPVHAYHTGFETHSLKPCALLKQSMAYLHVSL